MPIRKDIFFAEFTVTSADWVMICGHNRKHSLLLTLWVSTFDVLLYYFGFTSRVSVKAKFLNVDLTVEFLWFLLLCTELQKCSRYVKPRRTHYIIIHNRLYMTSRVINFTRPRSWRLILKLKVHLYVRLYCTRPLQSFRCYHDLNPPLSHMKRTGARKGVYAWIIEELWRWEILTKLIGKWSVLGARARLPPYRRRFLV